jgi:hypothetical protein
LHCHAVVDSKNWLDTFDHERRIFERPGLPDLTARELSEEVDNWIPLLQRAAEEGKMRLSDEIFLYESSLSAMDVRLPRAQCGTCTLSYHSFISSLFTFLFRSI